ncbi:hypothetical protein BK138_08540 [Paenibacillus rhizosphaerae]|uniref:ArpU family transcriptional regulator n=1 Tax=Paenibacillus rhizosphaerae TaxID=297318 RepID=A0A1R1F351_9BACL|nr:hypothetical protein [Paenibacillus rhizosphaerae]OMF58549.1 hypothetical protein BK138_08540 [Paenibacillus rhizosphaerae]
MPSLDKDAEKRVVSYLRKIHLALILDRHDDQTRRVLNLIAKMPEMEKQIITRKYIQTEAEYTRHQEIYRDLCISDGLYRKIRLSGLRKIHDDLTLRGISPD